MLNPLSIWKYYSRNLHKVIPLLAILALSNLAVTASAAIAGSMLRDIEKHSSLQDSFYTVRYQPLEAQNYNIKTLETKISALKNSEYYLKGKVRLTNATTILGTAGEWIFYFNKEDQQKFMQEIQWEVTEGRLPEKGSEDVALTEKLLLNKDLQIGSEFGNQLTKGEYLPGKHKISGKMKEKGDLIGGIGSLESLVAKQQDLDFTYYIHPNEGAKEALQIELTNLEKEFPGIEVKTDKSEKELNDSQFELIRSLVWSLDILVMLVICMSVALLNIIYFMQRSQEFGVLSALGYTRNYLLWRTFKESVVVILVSWVLGIAMTEAIYAILNNFLFNPNGIEGLTVLEPGTIVFSFPVPLTVTIFSLATILWHFTRMDAVAIVEKRD
ncbi:MAG: hypothetical protein OHK0017_02010 [Patescibacteria group bacterium]